MTKIRRVIVLTSMTFTMTFASTQNTYASMSTIELQKQVETLSKQGTLPFEMGLELIKRWQHL
ncbi:MAG TPA: hypothetical protein ENK39_09970 [Epsilonproteobacteria bacterium]|nr:hypothetical protein [Campylobacterota bacterium]